MKTYSIIVLPSLSMRKTSGLALLILATLSPASGFAETQPEAARLSNGTSVLSRSDELGPLLKQLDAGGPARHAAIRKLGELGTPEARQILLDVALGRRGSEYQEWAARCYIRNLAAKDDARSLLHATNPRVIAAGLIALCGEPITPEFWADLQHLLQSESAYVRTSCARVIRNAPSSPLRWQFAKSLIESIKTVEKVTRSQAWRGSSNALLEDSETGWVYSQLIRTLSVAPNITRSHLVQLTPDDLGVARDCVLIARVTRGDRSVRQELYRIARNAKSPTIRFEALDTLGYSGTVRDLPFLEEIATTDPLRVELSDFQKQSMKIQAPHGTVVPDHLYPIREQAKGLIRRMQAQAKKKN